MFTNSASRRARTTGPEVGPHPSGGATTAILGASGTNQTISGLCSPAFLFLTPGLLPKLHRVVLHVFLYFPPFSADSADLED